ncbi:MAG TPA: hypothetical protein DDZ53_11725 [Firmicutes bacterium]|nr:hypothetical protein [Bacillota bacterium]
MKIVLINGQNAPRKAQIEPEGDINILLCGTNVFGCGGGPDVNVIGCGGCIDRPCDVNIPPPCPHCQTGGVDVAPKLPR